MGVKVALAANDTEATTHAMDDLGKLLGEGDLG